MSVIYTWIRKHEVILGLLFGAIGAIAAIVAIIQSGVERDTPTTFIDNRDQSVSNTDISQSTNFGDINISVTDTMSRYSDSPFAVVPSDSINTQSSGKNKYTTQSFNVDEKDDVRKPTETQTGQHTKRREEEASYVEHEKNISKKTVFYFRKVPHSALITGNHRVATLETSCKKESKSGCTAFQRKICYALPEDTFILNNAVAIGKNETDGRKAICGVPYFESFFTRNDGELYPKIEYATSICANLHVESGSGDTNVGKEFSLSCEYLYQIGSHENTDEFSRYFNLSNGTLNINTSLGINKNKYHKYLFEIKNKCIFQLSAERQVDLNFLLSTVNGNEALLKDSLRFYSTSANVTIPPGKYRLRLWHNKRPLDMKLIASCN